MDEIIDDMQQQAMSNGLTGEILAEILKDEWIKICDWYKCFGKQHSHQEIKFWFCLEKARSLGTLLFSEATFQELQTTLSRSKFDRYVSLQVRSEFIFRLRLESELVEIVERIDLCRDEKDNKFLEVAG